MKEKTYCETAELLNISSSTINRYKTAIGITSISKPVNRTTIEKQSSMFMSMNTKANYKLSKEEMKTKLFPADQQLSKIKDIKTTYHISSELLNIQAIS